MKFGIDVQRHLAQNYNDVWPSTRFEAAYSGDGFSDFLLGIPNVVSGRLDIPTTSDLYNMYWAGYVQDDWKASSNLTINFGMRYEVATPIIERHGYPGQFDPLLGTGRPFEMQKGDCPTNPRACGGILYPKNNTAAKDFYTNLRPDIPYGILDSDSIFDTDKNNWAPRFGFALRPFGHTRTVIRGGYGINFYFKPLLNFARFIGQIPPADVRTSLTASPTTPIFTWDTLAQSAIAGVNLAQAYETNSAVGRENLNPYIQQWSLSVAQEIAQDTVVEAEYVGSKSTHTQISIDLELAPFDRNTAACDSYTLREVRPDCRVLLRRMGQLQRRDPQHSPPLCDRPQFVGRLHVQQCDGWRGRLLAARGRQRYLEPQRSCLIQIPIRGQCSSQLQQLFDLGSAVWPRAEICQQHARLG